MLEIIKIRSLKERANILSKFDPKQQTLLVSDLRSKFQMQKQIIKAQSYFEDHSVLRVSELWQLLLRRSNPDLRIISKDFLKTWLREKLVDCELEVARHRGEETLADFLELMFQVISHPVGSEQLTEWLQANPLSLQKWGSWYFLAQDLGMKLIETNQIATKWVAPLLSNQNLWEKFWQRPVIVDLGAELSRVEAELLKTLSKVTDVTLLMPTFNDQSLRQNHKFLMMPYEEVSGYGKLSESPRESRSALKPDCLRFTGPLSEVKYVTHAIRQLLEAGTPATDIAVIANDIEAYWPMLEIFFQEEGIPASKEASFRMQSLPPIHWWLSRLRVASQNYEYPDLELSIFKAESSAVRFEKFNSLFENLLDHKDLSRDPSILKALSEESIPKESIDLNYFIGVLTKFWPEEAQLPYFEIILRELLSVEDSQMKLKFSDWLFWLEQIVSKIEIPRGTADREGVQIISMPSADSSEFTHRFFLGLTESCFQTKSLDLISAAEIEQIYRDTGFQLQHPELSANQFLFEWLLASSSSQDFLFYPMSNFSGTIEGPHAVWMESSRNEKILVSLPPPTRIDSMMSHESFDELTGLSSWTEDWDPGTAKATQQKIIMDRGELAPEKIHLSERPSLSASQFERYFQCPFKFAAGKLFHLLDEAFIDLDADPRTLGNLVHQLFEKLAQEPRRYDLNESELAQILDEISTKIVLGDIRLWPPIRNKYVKLALRFLQEEKKTQSERKGTLFTELKFKKEIRGFTWSGSIDRVDELLDGSLSIMDYKASDRSYGISNWIKKNHLQLAFYSWLIKSQQIEQLKDREISGAFYYIYRDFKKAGLRPGQEKDLAQLPEVLTQLEEKMELLMAAVQVGDFPAKPLSLDECKNCRWSQLCRAPHLNQ